jgi:hypothetical protein
MRLSFHFDTLLIIRLKLNIHLHQRLKYNKKSTTKKSIRLRKQRETLIELFSLKHHEQLSFSKAAWKYKFVLALTWELN